MSQKINKIFLNVSIFALSFIIYKSRAHRDAVNKKVMAEMNSPENKKKYEHMPMPFDMKRFAYGGFKAIVEA